MRAKHKFDNELKFMLSFLTDDEFIEWLEENEIVWDKPLIDVIREDMNEHLPTS